MKFNTLYSAYYKDSCHPFNTLANDSIEAVIDPKEMKDDNSALILWGGTDINPALYGHPASKRTWANAERRDAVEWELLAEAVKRRITIIGVCRGAQMLCAAAGGFLVQDVQGHIGHHKVATSTGVVFDTNSIHHQMMCGLDKVDHELLAWSSERLSGQYVYKQDEFFQPPEGFVEPEYVYFNKIKGHAIQWHPEAMHERSAATKFIINVINEKAN